MNNETLPTHFYSKASQKEALDVISRQYEKISGEVSRTISNIDVPDLRPETHRWISIDKKDEWIAEHGELPKGVRYVGNYICFPEEGDYKIHNEYYYGIPNYVHQVREKHRKIWEYAGFDFNEVLGLATARDYIKSLPIVKKPKVEKSEGKRTERSATHRGCCQICGKSHKVDVKTGLLAEHGYTYKNTGYFTGSCAGSGQLPINVSVDFLKSEYKKIASKFTEFVKAEPEGIAYTYFTEKLQGRPLKYVQVEHLVTNRQARKELGAILLNWQPIIVNWKPSDLTPIKYDN
jgi:hypothetical protein